MLRAHLFFSLLVLIIIVHPPSPTLSSSLPLLAPVEKDHTTRQYLLSISIKTPLQPLKLILDLGGIFTWVDCYTDYTSSSYQHIPCNFSVCVPLDSTACGYCYNRPPGPTCSNNTCEYFPENPFTRKVGLEDALLDSLGLPATDGSNPGPLRVVLPDFLFSCAKTQLLNGFAKGATGLVALGVSNESIPVQLSKALSLPRCFALCLSASGSAPGVVFFGTTGPYKFLPGVDLSKNLIYTPILLNPLGSTVITYVHPAAEYFIGVSVVKVNGKFVPLNKTLLSIDQESGQGGTKISTVTRYTTLHTSLYKAVVDAFVKEASGAPFNLAATKKPVEPFGVCYVAKDIVVTRLGPAVPTIDLVLQRDDVFWRVFGSNSMVRIATKKADVWCLGVVDGGAKARTSIVIGGHQIEDNLLQFDLESMRLGFSSSVLSRQTTCANFNFTTNSHL